MRTQYADWQEFFPDWESIEKGCWSANNVMIRINDTTEMEIGLYREPDENEEYKDTYTLQVFVNDDVVACVTCK